MRTPPPPPEKKLSNAHTPPTQEDSFTFFPKSKTLPLTTDSSSNSLLIFPLGDRLDISPKQQLSRFHSDRTLPPASYLLRLTP